MPAKQRLDLLLVERGLAPSREKGSRFIRAGQVLVADSVVDLPGTKVALDSPIRIKGAPMRFVGRGGLKLEPALDFFKIDCAGKVAIDVGASTGGFTDCILQRGAVKVYAIDVGYNQLDWKLRNDERVVVREKTNARRLTPEQFDDPITLAVMDVSFISITLILPALLEILSMNGELVSLVKPQFEAGRESVGKGGIIKDIKVHKAVLEKIVSFCDSTGWLIKDLTDSPLPGAKGNREFFIHLQKIDNPKNDLKTLGKRITAGGLFN